MSDDKQKNLDELRQQIDALDEELGELLNKRAGLAVKVGKTKEFKEGQPSYYRPEREAEVLRMALARNQGPLTNEQVGKVFREVMSACLAVERPITVAYLGPEGTFTHAAALKHFGKSAVCKPFSAIDEVFREVEAGSVDYGVVPVENSTEGVINSTLDSFMDSNLKISGEVILRIHQHFFIGENTRKDKVSAIYSHASSLAQCRKWLDSYYPNADRIAVSSNAEAARRVNTEWHSAAIAGRVAGEVYGLNLVSEKIEDKPDNSTRFLIIGKSEVGKSSEDKTSIMVAMNNKPGALFKVLTPLNNHDLDMTRIESRPGKFGTWTYVFFIDFKGHISEANVSKAMEELRETAADVKVLGSYPKGVI